MLKVNVRVFTGVNIELLREPVTKTNIACIVFGVIAFIALVGAAFVVGQRHGREETKQDRLDAQVHVLYDTRADVEKRLLALESWRNRWGRGAPGASE